MKKFNRAGAALMAALMAAGTLAGCGSSDNGTAASTAAAAEGTTTAANGDVTHLKVWGFGYTATSDDCAAVAAEINKITVPEIGVEVELSRMGDPEKLNLAMNSGEQWDLVNFHDFSGGLSTLVATGMATPIDDLVQQYGQDMVNDLGEEYLALGKVGGELYSVPSKTQINSNAYGVLMRKDILDELGIDPDSIKGWDGVHDVLVKVKEAHPEMYPVVSTWAGGGQQKTFAWDNLGTGFWDGLGILENCHDSSTTVVNMYETESYNNFVETMYQWNKEGLIMKDATTSTENDLISNGVGFCQFQNWTDKAQTEESYSRGYGYPMVGIQLVDNFTTSDAGGNSFFIPAASIDPAKAMQLWNLMYSDPEIDNLLVNGVEGRDWEYTDDSKTLVKKIDGSTWDGAPYNWAWPNGTTYKTIEGEDPDAFNRVAKDNEAAAKSPALGFKFDNSMVLNEITACNNVIAKYDTGLRWGVMNPDETLDQFNQELYDAGLQTIIDEKQKQLDAFLAQ